MSAPDSVLPQWYELLSGLEAAEQAKWLADGVNPRDAKVELGKIIADRFHGAGAGEVAAAAFTKQFAQKQLPDDIPDCALDAVPGSVADLVVAAGCAQSKSEARRLVAQGGVSRIRGEDTLKFDDPNAAPEIADGDILKVGKRRYRRLKLG